MDRQAVDRLRYAIVKQACQDYFSAVRRMSKHPGDYMAKQMVIECEKFFRSEWFAYLYDLDGEYVIRALRERAKNPERLRFGGNGAAKDEEDDI